MQYKLQHTFGKIDIYLFDQLLKGTYETSEKVLDAGCGDGRNLVYFLNNGCRVYGIDTNPDAIEAVKVLSKILAPENPTENFTVTKTESLPFSDGYFDLVISSAVLHFAESEEHFKKMLFEMWRVLKPGGYFFARLASNIGIENKVVPLGNGRYLLPDESERFLVNEDMLLGYNHALNAHMYEPIKTTNVQNRRCMTTWCLHKA